MADATEAGAAATVGLVVDIGTTDDEATDDDDDGDGDGSVVSGQSTVHDWIEASVWQVFTAAMAASSEQYGSE